MPSGLAVMNNAVPGTRGTFRCFSMSARNISSGMEAGRSLFQTSSRPCFQVAMRRKIAVPITSGNQPPLNTFSKFAAKKAASTTRNTLHASIARPALQPHTRREAKKNSTVVESIVRVTAMP